MIFDGLGDLNYLAVLVAAVAYFVWGAIYYAPPIMGRTWQRAAGVSIPEGYRPNPMLFVATGVLYFITSVVIALVAAHIGSDTFGEGLALGVALGVGFAFAGTAASAIYERRPFSYSLINGVYGTIGYVIVGVIVSLWT